VAVTDATTDASLNTSGSGYSKVATDAPPPHIELDGIFGNINLNPDMFTRNEEVKEGEKVVEEVLPRLFMQELQELATALEVDTSAMLYEDDTR
jgi:hypothetical protein